MQLSKQGALTTKALTSSFGWGSAEAFQQQDVQELCRVLFDRLEDAFKGTPNEQLVNDLYQGRMVDYIETIGCAAVTRGRRRGGGGVMRRAAASVTSLRACACRYKYQSTNSTEFLDISLQVKAFGSDVAFSSVDESLRSFLKPEKLDGDNQYFCEEADAKFDAIKGFRLEKLPCVCPPPPLPCYLSATHPAFHLLLLWSCHALARYVLTLQLKRFDLDYTTFQRIKLNDQVRFPRVLDMNPFVAKANASASAGSKDEGEDVPAEDGEGKSAEDFARSVLEERERLLHAVEATKGAAAEGDVGELPDLVDASGAKAGDQVAEETEAARAARERKFAEDTDEDPAELVGHWLALVGAALPRSLVAVTTPPLSLQVKTQGEWVYELYAVLIHSGSALGGHYYAYIKNMTEGQWLNFNDSTVTAVSDISATVRWCGVPLSASCIFDLRPVVVA